MHPTSRLWLLVFLACAWCTHGVNVLMRKTVSRWQLYEDQLAAAARGSGVEINLFTANTSTEIPVDDFFSALKVMETQHWSVYDVVYVDVIWPAMLTSLLLPLEHTLSSAFLSTIDKGSLSAGYVNGSLYAIPVYGTDVGLFYRADLLAKYGYMGPPETVPRSFYISRKGMFTEFLFLQWAQMEEMMDRIIPAEHAAGHPSLAGYLGQLDGYEGATCNIMELLESYDAGGIIETQTDPVTGATSLTLSALNATKRANAMSALSMWQRWQQKGHFPTSALSFAEVNTLNLWRRGDVLFMRLWYLLPFLPIPDVPGADPQVAPLPGFTAALRGSAVNGANMVGVNRHSAHPDQAGKVLEAFLSSQFQHFVASIGEGTPMLTALKQDRSVCQLMNSCNVSSSQRVVSRPSAESGAHYSAVSSTIYSAFRIALLNVFPADHSIDWLTDRLGEVLNIKLGETRIVEWQSASSYFVIALSFLSPATAVALALLAMRTASNQGRLRRAEIGLISSMGAGMALLSAWPVLFLGPRTTLQCMLQPVFPGMGATVILTAVASHDLRVYLIVSSPLRRVAADVYRAMRVYSTLCILAEAAALALWAGMNQSVPTEVPAGYRVRNAGCSNGDYPALLSISVVVVFALMFAVAWLSWHANNLQSAQPLGRVPTLRVLYMLFMTGSICGLLFALPQLEPNLRVISGAIIVQLNTFVISHFYLRERIVATKKDPSVTTWMGATVMGATTEAFGGHTSAGNGLKSVGGGGAGSTPTHHFGIHMINNSMLQDHHGRGAACDQFCIRYASSADGLKMQLIRPVRMVFVVTYRVLILLESKGAKRKRNTFSLRGLRAIKSLGKTSAASSKVAQSSSSLSEEGVGIQLILASGVHLEILAPPSTARVLHDWAKEIVKMAPEQEDQGDLRFGSQFP